MSARGKKTRDRRHALRKQRHHQRKTARAAARERYAAALPGSFSLSPDEARCPHYQPGAVTGDWVIARDDRGRDALAICPGCMAYLFGPDLAAFLKVLSEEAA